MKIKKKVIIFFSSLFWPLLSQAQNQRTAVPNPLPNINSVPDLVGNIIKGFLGISGALALFFVVLGGILWMTSRGSADKVKSGRDTMVWALFGLAAVFLSYVIINAVLRIIQGA